MTSIEQKTVLSLIIAGSLIQIGILFSVSIPLGVPGEWVWPRLPQGTVIGFNLGCTLFVLLLYYLFLCWGAKRIERASSRHKTALLVLLCLASMSVLWNLKAVPGNIFGHAGMSWVTYYPRMSGYFTQGVSKKETTKQFLANYEKRVSEGDYLHQGTHPPGLILYFRFLHNVCESSPKLTRWLIASETEDVRAGLDVLNEISNANDHSFTPQQRATLWLSVLLTLLICAVTVLPIYFILARSFSSGFAFAMAGLWPLIPSLALFAPKSDLLLAFFSALLASLWIKAVCSNKLLPGVMAGFVLWAGLMTSLAIVVVPVILTLWTILVILKNQFFNPEAATQLSSQRVSDSQFIETASAGQDKHRGFSISVVPIFAIGAMAVGLLFPCLLIWGLFDLNIFSVWLINLSKHAEFYEHNSRTFSLWLFVNPLELAFSLGMPLFVLSVFTIYKAIINRFRSPSSLFNTAIVLVWLLLLISGKNMGEAARLWIFLFPLLLCVASHAWEFPVQEQGKQEQRPGVLWSTLFITQSLVVIAILCAIDAFDFIAV